MVGINQKLGVKLDGKKLEGREQLTSEIQKGDPKKTVNVLRDGKEIEFLLEWPATPVKK